MTVRILVDTSFLVAQLDQLDIHHPVAVELHARFRRHGAAYVYLDVIVNETVTVLARRALERDTDPVAVIRRVRTVIPSQLLAWTGPELPRLWERVMTTMEDCRGRLSFHDSLLVVIAREGGIERVASFDRSFDQIAGLKRIATIAAFDEPR